MTPQLEDPLARAGRPGAGPTSQTLNLIGGRWKVVTERWFGAESPEGGWV